MYRQ
jgi:Regulator of chromosome condensation (RCC1) repeat